MILLAEIIKRAQISFSSWLAIVPVSSLVLSSILITAGVYLIIRFNRIIVVSELFDIIYLFLFLQ